MNMQDEPRDEIFGQYEWQSWAFGNLREDYDFADVTLAFEDDQQAEAHKVILAGHWAEWGENGVGGRKEHVEEGVTLEEESAEPTTWACFHCYLLWSTSRSRYYLKEGWDIL